MVAGACGVRGVCVAPPVEQEPRPGAVSVTTQFQAEPEVHV